MREVKRVSPRIEDLECQNESAVEAVLFSDFNI